MNTSALLLEDEMRPLLKKTADHDQKAFEQLYRLASRRVFAFALRMVKSEDLAEDVVVETMYDVWKSASKFRGDSKISTWILGIARNKALMLLRGLPPTSDFEDIGNYEEILDSGMPDIVSRLAEEQMQHFIAQCLEKLSLMHRECIHLVHSEDLSMKEVALIQNVPEGTVKSRLSHARSHLAACMEATERRLSVSVA